MNLIQLTSRQNLDWSSKFVDETSYDQLVNETTTVLKPDGSILCILIKNAFSVDALKEPWSILRDYNPVSRNRGIASGEDRDPYYRKDGKLSKTGYAEPTNSGVIGFFERNARFPYCRACAWNSDHPEAWKKLLPTIQGVSALFAAFGGERYAKQAEIVRNSNQDFVIPGSVFTTVTVNKNFRTACHKDAGDLPDGLSCMLLIREGRYSGANLVFPDFRVAAKLDTGDLIIFDPHEFHGNTRLVPMSENFQRCTMVFYYREKIQHCLSMKEELDRVKNRKRGESLF